MNRPLSLIVAFLLFLGCTAARAVAGVPEVVDAETLRVDGKQYRLYGIDAPEAGQRCTVNEKLYDCADIAKSALMDLTAAASVICVAVQKAKPLNDGTLIARCSANGYDLSHGMVYTGWAMADPKTGGRNRSLEIEASRTKRGLWRGDFVKPWDWRAGKRLPEEKEE